MKSQTKLIYTTGFNLTLNTIILRNNLLNEELIITQPQNNI